MKKMVLNNDNLLRDNTRLYAAKGTSIKVWGFIPVKLRAKGKEGEIHEANECLYFAEGILTTLVSLGALKNLGCVSKNFPYPETESGSSLTKRNNRDKEEDEKEVVVKIRSQHQLDQNRFSSLPQRRTFQNSKLGWLRSSRPAASTCRQHPWQGCRDHQ